MLIKLKKLLLSVLCISMIISLIQPNRVTATESVTKDMIIEEYEDVEPVILNEDTSL